MSTLAELTQQTYTPHGYCLLWQPEVVWLNVVSDGLIAAAYFSIPFLIYYFVRMRKDLRFTGIFHLFSAFILLCGVTHLFSVVNIWDPVYFAHGLLKAATGLVSVITAIILYRLIPKALALPGPEDMAREQARVAEERRQRLELEALHERDVLLELALKAAPGGLLMVDEALRVHLTNERVCQLLGLPASEVIGSPLQNLIRVPAGSDTEDRLHRFLKPTEADAGHSSTLSIQAELRASDDTLKPVELTFRKSPEVGQAFVILAIADLAERNQVEQELRQMQRRYDRIISGSQNAAWEWNLKTGDLWWSPNLNPLIGRAASASQTVEAWVETIHPDFRERVTTHLETHLREGSAYNIEFLGQGQDGTYRWFNSRGQTQRDSAGNPHIMSGILSDIHESKMLAEDLRWQQQAMESLSEASASGLMLLRPHSGDWQIQFCNPEIGEILKVGRSSLLGLTLQEAESHCEDSENLLTLRGMLGELADETATSENLRDYHGCWWKMTLKHWQNEKVSDTSYVVVTATDISDLKQIEENLARLLADRTSLFNETHHRVKNNLQVISSLIDIQGRQSEPAERARYEELSQRVRAMSLIHELLYQQEEYSEIPLKTYMEQLIQLVVRSSETGERVEWSISGETGKVRIPLQRMVPLGLLLCEVITNACKYAFANRRGRLEVSLEQSRGQLRIKVCDDGPGFPEAVLAGQTSTSLGINLIQGFARQARFDLILENTPGASVTLLSQDTDRNQ